MLGGNAAALTTWIHLSSWRIGWSRVCESSLVFVFLPRFKRKMVFHFSRESVGVRHTVMGLYRVRVTASVS